MHLSIVNSTHPPRATVVSRNTLSALHAYNVYVWPVGKAGISQSCKNAFNIILYKIFCIVVTNIAICFCMLKKKKSSVYRDRGPYIYYSAYFGMSTGGLYACMVTITNNYRIFLFAILIIIIIVT